MVVEFKTWVLKQLNLMMLAGLLSLSVLCVQNALAETAVANDAEAEDAVVLKKIIQPDQQGGSVLPSVNQPSNPNAQKAEQTPQVPAATVENDMAEGESIRQLPSLNAPVIDQANILSADEKQQLDQKIRNLNNQGKAQIGIIIVPTTGQESIFDYAMRAAETWKLGSAKQDNGLLIAVAINDHRLHIATGYGLEGVIPDIVANRIIREQITPYFKQNAFGQGLISGVNEIERILNLDPEIAQKAADELKERQAQAIHEQQAKQRTLSTVFFILIAGIVASFIIGNRLSASVAGVTAFAASMIYGSGLIMSLILGGGIFILLITSIGQLLFQMFLSGGGRGGSGGGGFGGGGGYSGGGGGFGGGGASGSW
ncbi:TPM domain-containing protein [Acinetobacter shaoyimingii]|uniref:TPM domain-containing protein n=2 Tax=Acinetobacter shaoyimingii TaxID=2715164 RepID=A0A6G8RYM6_9GAMM|nr:TPM domain-containing protein [Acinetobacter shaoyimingii]